MGYARDKMRLTNIAVEKAIRTEPSLTNDQLCTRFGCTKSVITKIRKRVGVTAPFSEYVTDYDLKRGKAIIDISDSSYKGTYYGSCMRKRTHK